MTKNEELKYGKFIESKISKNAPFIFIIGGKDVNKVIPGKYMMDGGFKSLSDFNIYNIKRTDDGNVYEAWKECKDYLKAKGINPSKRILVGYSKGAEYLNEIYKKDKWDLVFSSGAAIPSYKGNYKSNKALIQKLTIYDENTKPILPISSKFVYVHSNIGGTVNGDGQLSKIANEFKTLLPPSNTVTHNGYHAKTVTATANWIKNNVIVNKDGSAKIKIKTPSSNTKANPDLTTQSDFGGTIQGQLNKSFNTSVKTEETKSKGPVTSQSDKCETNEKRPAVKKANEAAAGAGNVKKDPTPPPKNETPQFSSDKYNHRYYILPITYTEKIKDTDDSDGLNEGIMGTSDRAQQQFEARLKTYSVSRRGLSNIIIKTLPEEAAKIKSEKRLSIGNVTIQILDIKEISSEKIKKNETIEIGFAGSTKQVAPKPKNTASERIVSYPDTLENMVKKTGPWYNRYWAYRLNSGPNYGFEKYESTISDKGIELISAVIPYWKPPKDDKNPDNKPKVKGIWKNLLKKVPPINSPIDVPIVLNSYQSGVMNVNIRYIYESENELHMTILESEIINKGKLAIGQGLNDSDALNKVPDSSWANYPRWSGIFAEHCLKNSGFTLQEKLGTNIDFYHRSIISRGRLVNHPGNEVMPWSTMKELGVKNRIFKPSKIWLDPKYSNAEELLQENEDSTIAIFIIGYHINRNGTLTDKGKQLVNHINNNLKWSMATISAVPHHASNSTICYTDVLLYMDENGTVVTIGGNTDVPGADFSVKSGNHIAVKVTNFAKFAKATANTYVNGSVIVAKVKSGPKPETYRESAGLSNKLFTTPIFNAYTKARTNKKWSEQLNSEYYDKLLPYITNVNICSTANSAEREDDSALKGETNEPEYISKDYVKPPDMEDVSTENCSKLQEKYDLTKSLTFIPGVSAKAVNTPINNTGCVGGLSPVHIANIMAFVAAKESSSTYDITNSAGYNGRFQFGSLALIDIGFLRRGGRAKNPKDWTGVLSKKLGISSRKQFLECPIAQEIAMQEWIKILWGYLEGSIPLKEMPCDKIAGYIVAAHLLGAGSVRQWHKDKIAKVDGNGVSTDDYFELGVNAANGIFKTNNRKLKSNIPGAVNRGEKYFLYPGPLSNGIGSMKTLPQQNESVITSPTVRPQPVNDNIEIGPGEFFVKFSPSTVRIVTIPQFGPADEIGLKTYKPEEFIRVSGAKNGIVCSWTEDPGNKFGRLFIPPLKTEHINFTTFNGQPAYKLVPRRLAVPYLCYIDTNNNFHMTRERGVPVPADAKYAFSTKWLGSYKSNGKIIIDAPKESDKRERSMIGRLDDGNMFVWSTSKTMKLFDAARIVSKIPGVVETLHLDGGNSAQLYFNGKFVHRVNSSRKFPNYLIWD